MFSSLDDDWQEEHARLAELDEKPVQDGVHGAGDPSSVDLPLASSNAHSSALPQPSSSSRLYPDIDERGWRWPGGVADSAHLGLGSCYCWSGHRQVGQISPSSDAVRSASSVLGISWTVFSAAELPTTAAVHAQRAGSSSTGLCDCVSIILSHYWYD